MDFDHFAAPSHRSEGEPRSGDWERQKKVRFFIIRSPASAGQKNGRL